MITIHKTKPKHEPYRISLPINDEPIPLGIYKLGRLIKFMRICRGFTQQQMANHLGTSRQHVQKWEYGIVKPRPDRMAEILDLLHFHGLNDVIQRYYY